MFIFSMCFTACKVNADGDVDLVGGNERGVWPRQQTLPNSPPTPPRDQRLTILFPKYRFILLELLIRYTLEQRSTRVTFSTSWREWEFLLFNLAHWDETRIFWHLISGFETRSRKILLQSRSLRRHQDLLSSFSGFETRERIPLIWSRFSRREREF